MLGSSCVFLARTITRERGDKFIMFPGASSFSTITAPVAWNFQRDVFSFLQIANFEMVEGATGGVSKASWVVPWQQRLERMKMGVMVRGLRVGGEPGLGESGVRAEAAESGAARHGRLWESLLVSALGARLVVTPHSREPVQQSGVHFFRCPMKGGWGFLMSISCSQSCKEATEAK